MTNLNAKTFLQFGKHRGSTVKEVMDIDMDYKKREKPSWI